MFGKVIGMLLMIAPVGIIAFAANGPGTVYAYVYGVSLSCFLFGVIIFLLGCCASYLKRLAIRFAPEDRDDELKFYLKQTAIVNRFAKKSDSTST